MYNINKRVLLVDWKQDETVTTRNYGILSCRYRRIEKEGLSLTKVKADASITDYISLLQILNINQTGIPLTAKYIIIEITSISSIAAAIIPITFSMLLAFFLFLSVSTFSFRTVMSSDFVVA